MFRCSNDLACTHRLNRFLLGGAILLALFQMIALPALLLPQALAWGWLLLPAVLLSNSVWALIHEAVHGVMFADRQANRIAGRALSIYFGAAFDLLRWGHLLHHIYSRTRRERSEVFSGARPTLRFTMAYYLRISGGLYAAEVCGSALLLLPRRWLTAVRRRLAADDNVIGALAERLLAPQVLRSARFDALCILTAHALALWLYGAHAWLYILSLAGRGFMISIVDNAFHYGTALDAPRAGMNLRLPGFLSALILHFNLHGVHHLRPGLPWRQLPAYHAKLAAGYQDDWWPAVLRQWRGPLAESSLRERHALKTA